jgi:predicted permease
VHPGFDAQDVVTFGLTLPQSRYETPSDVAAFHMLLLERLSGLPGVISAGAAANIPFAGDAAGTAFDIEDQPTTQGELPPMMWYTFATPQYFETMRIPVVSGRSFEPRDHEQGAGTTIVSQALAERLWPGEDAVGKQLRFSGDSTGWDRVVGVVGSVRDRGLREDPSELIYHPMMDRQRDEGRSVRAMGYVVRARNPEALMNSIRAAVWELDPELPITSVGTIEGLMEDSIVQLSFTTMTLVIAAVMAVALGAIGLYGVLAYLVAQRRQEIGVRIALGAQVAEVRRMVVKQGARLAIMGLGVGLVGAFGLTRFLDALLFGTAPLDPMAFAATSAALLGVVMLASYLPARRASSVDPVEALRNE